MSFNGMNESERTFLAMIEHLMGPNKKSATGIEVIVYLILD